MNDPQVRKLIQELYAGILPVSFRTSLTADCSEATESRCFFQEEGLTIECTSSHTTI